MTSESGGHYVNLIRTILPWLGILVCCFILLAIIIFSILRIINYYRKYSHEQVVLELTPPAFSNKAPIATSKLFSVLHGLFKSRSFSDTVFRYVPSFSLEIISTKNQGIRYFLRASKKDEELLRQAVAAYNPDVIVQKIQDNKELNGYMVLQTYKQANHYAMPLDTTSSLQEHDPVSYLTNSMTKLENNEKIHLQLVVTPTVKSEAFRIDRKIRQGYLSGSSLEKRFGPRGILRIIWYIVKMPLKIIWSFFYGFFYNDLPSYAKSLNNDQTNKRVTPAEQELLDQMHSKLTQDLFCVDMRALIIAQDKKRAKSRARSLANAVTTFATPTWQRLRISWRWAPRLSTRYRHWKFKRRLPSLIHRSANIFSVSELGSIYHFPHSSSARTENIAKSLSKSLPAPIYLKDSTNKFDVFIGKNIYHGQDTMIGLTKADRQRHMYVLGGTGNGKTTMLKYQIIQDINAGYGLAVVDPHGDLAEDLLGHIPEHRLKDVIYLNPDDLEYPIGINLLELPKGLSESGLLREKDLVTESTVSVLRKIFSEDDSGGHRIEYILRNTIHTALTLPEANLFTIFRLLNDTKFRKSVVKQLEDQDLKNFWMEELGKAGEMQKVKMAAGITAKIGRFLFSASARGILEQNESTINFESLMDENKILICNVSKGLLGEDTSSLFGITILAKLQLASLRRARQHSSMRRDFYLYVDEFQNFATMSFVQMLSEARKYKLFLVMAEQSTQQQKDQQLVEIILANVGSVIAFRSGSPADEQLILPLFKPYLNDGEIANLPAYSFYARISAKHTQEPMSGITLLGDEVYDKSIANRVKQMSRDSYGKKKVEVKKQIVESINQDKNTKPRSLIKAKKEVGAA